MTAAAVGARSGDPERAHFFGALLVSLLLHGLLFAIKVGPAPGTRMSSLPSGGVIEAVLRRAPTTPATAEPPGAASVQPAQAEATPDTLKTSLAAEIPRRSEIAAAPPAATMPQPATLDAPGQRNEGQDAIPGARTSGAASSSVPLLPPLPATVRQVPGHPSLRAPLGFTYPPNVRVQSGRVRVRILLDDKGRVEEMHVVASVPPGFFDHAAIEALRPGSYAPGFVGAMRVRSYMFMDVTFGPGPQGQQISYAGSAFAPPPYPR